MAKGKTNAVRILESLGILHDIREYECGENSIDAVSVARIIGAEEETVFKTLVARGDKTGVAVFCLPGNFELNLKKAAAISGNKHIEMLHVRELQPVTGYIRGGCSPVGMKKSFPTWIDETALLFERIYVSAGMRGMQIHLAPRDLAHAAGAAFADIT